MYRPLPRPSLARLSARALLVACLLAPSLLLSTSHAAISGSILAGTVGAPCELAPTCLAFVHSQCRPDLATKDGGIGASVTDVSAYAGTQRTLKGTMAFGSPPGPEQSGAILLLFRTSACVGLPNVLGTPLLKPKTFTVPSKAKWIVLIPSSLLAYSDYRWTLS